MQSLEQRQADRRKRLHMEEAAVATSDAAIATLQTDASAEVARGDAEAEAAADVKVAQNAQKAAGQKASAAAKKANPFGSKKK